MYISFHGAAPDATFTLARDHWHTEQHLRASGLPHTFLRDNLHADFTPALVGDDVIRGPAGDGQGFLREMPWAVLAGCFTCLRGRVPPGPPAGRRTTGSSPACAPLRPGAASCLTKRYGRCRKSLGGERSASDRRRVGAEG
uniref:hypothetical protein n=1 Tax=Streptomyces millisiae TaxID=3075542 RepID=UPI00374E0185